MQPLHTILTRRFFLQSLIPILMIEASLIATLFVLNHYQASTNKEALETIAAQSYEEIVAQTSDLITQRFECDRASLAQIAQMTATIFEHNGEFPVDPNAWNYIDGFYQLNMRGKNREGFYLLPPSQSTSVYTTNLSTLDYTDYNVVTALSLLLPSIEATVRTQNNLLASAWVNIDKRYALTYPPVRPQKRLRPDLDVTQTPFYYLVDPAHNPEKQSVFVPLHLESWALEAGELGAFLQPLYANERFIGVIGLTLTAEAVATAVRHMELPFDAYAMLLDPEDHLIVASDPDSVYARFGIHSFYEMHRKSGSRQNVGMQLERGGIDPERTLLYERPIPGTDFRLLIATERDAIFETVNRVSSRSVAVGIAFIVGITLFYVLFFWQSMRSMRRLAQTIASPLRSIVAFSSTLGRREDSVLEESRIDEFQELNSNLNRTHEKLLEMVIRDPGTGLYNRNKMLEDLQSSGSILMRLQLRNYHPLQNLYGQDAADAVVKATVLELKTLQMPGLYRIAEDEFCLRLDTENPSLFFTAYDTLSRLCVRYSDIEIHPFFFAGIALKAPLFDEAGIALLEAQRLNAPYPVTSAVTGHTKESFLSNIAWSSRLNHALAQSRLVPYFQPIYNLQTGRIDKFESLVRMIEADEVIAPFHFLKAAADMGKTHEITRMMIDKVCAVAAAFPDTGFTVNISFRDFTQFDLPAYLLEQCHRYGVAPTQITLELLETEALDDSVRIVQAVTRLKQSGFSIAIDDFGTGHSNFAHLMSMKVDFIKIDGSFIKEIAKDPSSATITRTISQFAALMGARTVAEFVADEQILKRVRQFGIHYAQGYAISPPLPPEKLPALLERYNTNIK